MTILWVTREEIFNGHSGAKIVIRKRIEQMAKREDLNIEVFSVVEANEEKKKAPCPNLKLHYFTRQKKSALNFLKNLLLFYSIPYTISNRVNHQMTDALKKKILEGNIEIIVFEHLHTAYYQEELAGLIREYNIKTVLGCHNIESEEVESMYRYERNPLKKMVLFLTYLLMIRYEKQIYNKNAFDLYYFLSKADMESVLDRLNPEIKTIFSPPGVELMDHDSAPRDGDHINIGFVGIMDYAPNIEACTYFFEKVFRRLKNKDQFRFYIIGKDPCREITELARKDKGVIVTGLVEDVAEYYKNMHLVVLPMVTGSGVKIKLFEALSYGKVVISTPKGIQGTEFENEKHLIVVNSDQEFIDALENYAVNQSRFQQTARKGLEFLRSKYHWGNICDSFLAAVQRL